MRYARFVRPCVLAASVVLLGSALATPAEGDTPAEVQPVATRYPTNAAKIFRWGNAQVKDEFHGALSSRWSVTRRDLIRNQHGMLTLNGTETSGTLVASLTGQGRQYGRWEARVRSRQYSTTGTPYRVIWELVPRGEDNCGARGIVLSDYAIGTNVAAMHLRNLPDADFTTSKALPLGRDVFHTYAVEVTPDRISWFVDTRVVMTERRPAARTGATYDLRFRLQATPGARMNKGRMQMDWVRYYTLARKNAQSIEAPAAQLTTYADAC